MIKAASPYVRIKIRVPEAYLLVRAYETTRPGFLITDADFRRVASIRLLGAKAAAVARTLQVSLRTPALERYLIQLTGKTPPVEALRALLARQEGVSSVTALRKTLIAWVKPGALTPARLTELAGSVEAKLVLRDPVAVAFAAPKQITLEALETQVKAVAGTWATHKAKGLTAHVSRYLVDPIRLAEAGALPDVLLLRFKFSKLAKGGGGAAVAFAALRLAGVLMVVPDIFNDRMLVIVRKGQIDAKKIEIAFEKFGGEVTLVAK